MPRPTSTATSEEGYSEEEFAWLKGVQAYQKRSRRKFLTHVEYLRIAIELGYRPPGASIAAPVTSPSSHS